MELCKETREAELSPNQLSVASNRSRAAFSRPKLHKILLRKPFGQSVATFCQAEEQSVELTSMS